MGVSGALMEWEDESACCGSGFESETRSAGWGFEVLVVVVKGRGEAGGEEDKGETEADEAAVEVRGEGDGGLNAWAGCGGELEIWSTREVGALAKGSAIGSATTASSSFSPSPSGRPLIAAARASIDRELFGRTRGRFSWRLRSGFV